MTQHKKSNNNSQDKGGQSNGSSEKSRNKVEDSKVCYSDTVSDSTATPKRPSGGKKG
jgi:hypothetical protein